MLSARLYDTVLATAERRALRDWRRQLITGVGGTVLEIGAGTGANLPAYGRQVERLLLLEPDPTMRRRVRGRAAAAGRGDALVMAGSAARLPLRDASVDAVVSTLVLCSVGPPERALAEIRRVLRPDGELHLIEHVAAEPGTRVRGVQQALSPVWSRVAGGCSLIRPTRELLASAGFDVTAVHQDVLPVPVPFVRPVIRGTARPSQEES